MWSEGKGRVPDLAFRSGYGSLSHIIAFSYMNEFHELVTRTNGMNEFHECDVTPILLSAIKKQYTRNNYLKTFLTNISYKQWLKNNDRTFQTIL